MKKFMDKDFLLNSPTAIELFEHVKDLPIIDYHCHLVPQEIASNKRFRNITDLALGGDHYKWRLLRANGVDEKFITGNGSDEEKFFHWCNTLQDCIGSPLYHWTHLEMRRYFNYDGDISDKTAADLYAHCNEIIAKDDFTAWNILKKFNVEQIGTTDDPIDNLEHHATMIEARKADPKLPIVYPTLRPSRAMNIEVEGFADYIKQLAEVSGQAITSYETLQAALSSRIDFFHSMGCRLSDHALDPPVYCEKSSPDAAFKKALAGDLLSTDEIDSYKTAIMVWLGTEYHKRGWVMQLHMGAQRSNNTRMINLVGADTGFDSMSDLSYGLQLAKILNALEMQEKLPKTVLYGLNPVSDTLLGTMIGNFQGGGIPGKIQWGSAWWFNDTKVGMQNHMVTLADTGMLARFIGMLTDSRSFMSYPRHEYFRRIMVQVLADFADNGEFPGDMAKLKQIAEGIAYTNAKSYL